MRHISEHAPHALADPRIGEVVEALALDEVSGPDPGEHRRSEVHVIVVAREGTATFDVDFESCTISSGMVTWIRPGQVIRLGGFRNFTGARVVFPAGLLDPAVEDLVIARLPSAAASWVLAGGDWAEVVALTALLTRWHGPRAGEPGDPLRRAAARHTLTALALRLVQETPAGPERPPTDVFSRFRSAVERDFARRHQVGPYARELGLSSRTLSRATRASAGVSPKQVIDSRILVEAKRLLAHTDLPVGGVGAELGFDDPSNFTAWFAGRADVTPSSFRERLRRETTDAW
jgi:AraC-like DNA-binding protein